MQGCECVGYIEIFFLECLQGSVLHYSEEFGVLVANNHTLKNLTQTRTFFFLAMLIGTIDLYHFIPFSVTLTLAGSHKVSTNRNPLPSFSKDTFDLTKMKFGLVLEVIQVQHSGTTLSEIW